MAKIDEWELRKKFWNFRHYMNAKKWDALGDEGVYADEGEIAVSAFIEYVLTGQVTDNDGNELGG